MRQLLKKLARMLLGDYSVYYIYACKAGRGARPAANASGLRFAPLQKEQVESSKEVLITDQSTYHGSESHAYGYFQDSRIVASCYFWHGARYRERNFWPLADGEAKLVQIVVIPPMRGRAVATSLIARAAEDMFKKGFRCLYARIWFSNAPSWHAFRRAGWTRIAVVIEARPLLWLAPRRVVFRLARHSDAGASRGPLGMTTTVLTRLRRAGLNYACFKIFTLRLSDTAVDRIGALPAGYRFAELSLSDLQSCPFIELKKCQEYGGAGSQTFGIFREDGVLVCVQCVWFGERYRQSAFWPIEPDAAVSMHLVTAASEQGKGLATGLKQHSARQMKERGFGRLYSRIWWTNASSLRVSEKAGWACVAIILELFLPWARRPIRWVIPRVPKRSGE
jgi:RimJ/RimL family protein N-acetyltransferase